MIGGLGLIKDDIIKKVFVEFIGGRLFFYELIYQCIEWFFKQFGCQLMEVYWLQFYMLDNVMLLINLMGIVLGMWFEVDGKVIVFMLGVFYEMKVFMQKEVLFCLKVQYFLEWIVYCILFIVGEGEFCIVECIVDFEDVFLFYIKLVYLFNLGRVWLWFSSWGSQFD